MPDSYQKNNNSNKTYWFILVHKNLDKEDKNMSVEAYGPSSHIGSGGAELDGCIMYSRYNRTYFISARWPQFILICLLAYKEVVQCRDAALSKYIFTQQDQTRSEKHVLNGNTHFVTLVKKCKQTK